MLLKLSEINKFHCNFEVRSRLKFIYDPGEAHEQIIWSFIHACTDSIIYIYINECDEMIWLFEQTNLSHIWTSSGRTT